MERVKPRRKARREMAAADLAGSRGAGEGEDGREGEAWPFDSGE